MEFYDLALNDQVLDALDSMRFSECTPIQEQAIPPLLDGRDLIGVAQTGTGKTAAFLLPVLNALSEGDYPTDAINCLIMAPTRELAKQIDEQLQGFSYFLPISSIAVYGGNDGPQVAQQRQGLKMGADIVISTPGRLISHLNMGYVDLSKVSFFILDEADRMLDMGFYEDIMKIESYLPKNRQTIMFSATMPPKIKKLAGSILQNPAQIQIAVSRPADNICQQIVMCYEGAKIEVIKQLFSDGTLAERTIIFASSKQKVKELTATLKRMKHEVAEMHSDLSQAERDEVMLGFKSGRIRLLVATDIVARGIDVDDIRVVINYDVPREGEEYVHRIGRTARAGNDGRAITFVSPEDMFRWTRIERFLGKEIEIIESLSSFDRSYKATRQQGHNRGNGGNSNQHGGNRNGNGGRKNENGGRRSENGGHRNENGGNRNGNPSRRHGRRKSGNAQQDKGNAPRRFVHRPKQSPEQRTNQQTEQRPDQNENGNKTS
jgi:superfamily II DNA/RNA helicase